MQQRCCGRGVYSLRRSQSQQWCCWCVDRGSVVTGLSTAATLSDAATLSVEEAFTVCDGADLSSGIVERSVSIGGINGGGGAIFMCVCLGVLGVVEG